jgi:ketosteroid isomerase-like protein
LRSRQQKRRLWIKRARIVTLWAWRRTNSACSRSSRASTGRCEERDPDAAAALWAADDDVTVFGSEQSDTAVGPAAIRSNLEAIAASSRPISFAWRDRRVRVDGAVAWVNASGTLAVDGSVAPYQVTGVFVRREGRWLWHTHSGSVPQGGAS